MSYKRNFVTLKEKDAGFSLKGSALGRCIIESKGDKGKISVSVQNLKPEIMYKACLISSNGDGVTGITLGSIPVDKNGKGELKVDVDTQSVNESGIDLSSFQIITVMVSDKEGMLAPLEGYTGKEIAWQRNFKEPKKQDKKEIVTEELIAEPESEVESKAPDDANTESSSQDDTELTQEPELIQESELQQEPEPQQEPTPQPIPIIEETVEQQTPNHTTVPVENKIEVMPHSTAASIKNYTLNDEIEKMLLNNTKIIPFKSQVKDFRWVRISLKETIHLPVNFWGLINDPFIVSSFKKHGHLILGVCGEHQKEYLLGIPDVYNHKNKTRANTKGFVQFKCCENVPPKENEGGYWIMPIYII